ncbi:hypothetical protein ACOME3_006849 [Neoechinorhynchus agilis]
MDGLPIKEIPMNLSDIFPKLSEIYILQHTALSSNLALDFAGNVKKIHLQDTKIEQIYLTKILPVEEIVITGSKLSSIHPEVGKGLPFLNVLSLSNNNLSNINTLVGFCSLRELNIDENQIAVLEFSKEMCFSNLKKISALKNPTYSTKIDASVNLNNLREIKISVIGGIGVHIQELQKIQSLQRITIQGGADRRYDASELKNLWNLRLLELIKGNLKAVPKGGILTNTTITALSVAWNSILTIQKSDFEQWTRLEYLDLSNNNMKFITFDAFELLFSLRILSFKGNNVPKKDVFSSLFRLRWKSTSNLLERIFLAKKYKKYFSRVSSVEGYWTGHLDFWTMRFGKQCVN